jgi:hypothetical protein
VVASAQQRPDQTIAIDDDYVYWTNIDGQSVMRASKATGQSI